MDQLTVNEVTAALRKRSSFVVRRSSFVVRRSSFVFRRSSFVVRRSSFVVRRSFAVRSLFVRRSPFLCRPPFVAETMTRRLDEPDNNSCEQEGGNGGEWRWEVNATAKQWVVVCLLTVCQWRSALQRRALEDGDGDGDVCALRCRCSSSRPDHHSR